MSRNHTAPRRGLLQPLERQAGVYAVESLAPLIERLVAARMGITVADIGSSRLLAHLDARAMCCILLRRLGQVYWPALASRYGRRRESIVVSTEEFSRHLDQERAWSTIDSIEAQIRADLAKVTKT